MKNKPLFIIGSPPCDQSSIMQNLNNGKRDPEEVRRKMIEAKVHLEFCAELYHMQMNAGRYYLHEHPTSAASGKEKCMKQILTHPEAFITRIHMCAYEMKIPDKNGNQHVYKPTQFITNAPLVAAQLERKCDRNHKHAQLQSNRTSKAAIYPDKLIDAVCKGINDQIRTDQMDINIIASINLEKGLSVLDELKQLQLNAAQCHEELDADAYAVDDVSGANLDPKMVVKARADEIEYVRTMKLYTKVPISECMAKTGKQPIATRWIDVNKQDAANPLYRSRLVGK